MKIKYVEKTKDSMNQSVASGSRSGSGRPFVDNRPEAAAQLQRQAMADNYSTGQAQSIQNIENKTGLPASLKSGIETLSGFAMDDVKVHYNSDKPAKLHAHAYAQGSDIHLSPGQQKHLPHEAWHVVQQKQGRVQATRQMKSGVHINDDGNLEKEADAMGAKAISANPGREIAFGIAKRTSRVLQTMSFPRGIVQRNLNTKSSAHGDKVDGSMPAVTQEVTDVIARNKPGEMVEDIGKLETSIASRTSEQESFSNKSDPTYISHGVRIAAEQVQLARLEAARAIELASRPPKPVKNQPDADGWTEVS